MEIIFRSTPNGVLMAHTGSDGTYWVGARCGTEAFSTTCAVLIVVRVDGSHGSVAEHWWLKPEVSLVQLPVAAGFFTFLCFCLIISKFINDDCCYDYMVHSTSWIKVQTAYCSTWVVLFRDHYRPPILLSVYFWWMVLIPSVNGL